MKRKVHQLIIIGTCINTKMRKRHEDYQSTYNFSEPEPQEVNVKGQCK